jgi:hypothetical protein
MDRYLTGKSTSHSMDVWGGWMDGWMQEEKEEEEENVVWPMVSCVVRGENTSETMAHRGIPILRNQYNRY